MKAGAFVAAVLIWSAAVAWLLAREERARAARHERRRALEVARRVTAALSDLSVALRSMTPAVDEATASLLAFGAAFAAFQEVSDERA